MRLSIPAAALVLMLALSQANLAAADTRYISDQLVVTLRQGKGDQYPMLKTLKTGTPIEVLDEDSSYVRARVKSGEEGYIRKQYVTRETPKPVIIAQLEKQNARLKKELSQSTKELAEQQTRSGSAAEEATRLREELTKTETELREMSRQYEELLATSENVIQIADQLEQFQAENNKLTIEVQQLREESATVLRTGMIRWFLAGGGVFFVGWLSGKISRKKRRGGFS